MRAGQRAKKAGDRALLDVESRAPREDRLAAGGVTHRQLEQRSLADERPVKRRANQAFGDERQVPLRLTLRDDGDRALVPDVGDHEVGHELVESDVE